MYKPFIGLEVHAELETRTKMFCSCLTDSNELSPNFLVCPICLGHPGTLPVANQEAIKKVIKTGLALHCRISKFSKFDRKNYFYPDLPKGYQISQYDMPLCQNGYLVIPFGNSPSKKIKIRRIHLEEDTGKLIHSERGDYSLVDFNRAGLPLMELVTEPDINSAQEAKEFSRELQLILRCLQVSEANMEKGQLRFEVNISLGKGKKLGTKVEIKNLNSFRSVEKAIDYEIQRQTEMLRKKGKIVQETRGWNDFREITFSQRAKEEAHDYRYFPEPDLPLFFLTQKFIQEIQAEIPELPGCKRERFKKEYNLKEKELEIFIDRKDLAEYFEKAVSKLVSSFSKKELPDLVKLTVNYLTTDLQALLKERAKTKGGLLITPEHFAKFIALIYQGKISSKTAKIVLLEIFESGADPLKIIEKKGLAQISNEQEIEKIIKQAVKDNPKPIEDYKKGKENALQFLVGLIMAKTKGKANPQLLNKTLKAILDKD